MSRVLPSSPNWYCSKIIDVVENEILVFGARCDVNILQVNVAHSSHCHPYHCQTETQNHGDGVVQAKIEVGENKNEASSHSEIDAHTQTLIDNREEIYEEKGDLSCACDPQSQSESLPLTATETGSKRANQDQKEAVVSIKPDDPGTKLMGIHSESTSDNKRDGTDIEVNWNVNTNFSNSHNQCQIHQRHGGANTKSFNENASVIEAVEMGATAQDISSALGSTNVELADCVLVATLSRLHKEKITCVRLLKCDEINEGDRGVSDRNHFSYLLFTGAEDGKIKYHRLSWARTEFGAQKRLESTLKSEHQLPKNHKITCAEICGEQILIGDDKGSITSWTWKNMHINEAKLNSTGIVTMEFGKSEKLLAVGTKNGVIFIYNILSHQVDYKLKGHLDEIHSLQWKPSALKDQYGVSCKLISGSKDRTLKLWDLSMKRAVCTGKLPSGGRYKSRQEKERVWLSLVWLSTGQVISSSLSGELLVWTMTSGVFRHYTLAKGHNRIVFTLTLFGEDSKLVSTSMDRGLIVWDLTAGSMRDAQLQVTGAPSDASEIEAEGHIAGDDDEGLWKRAEQPADRGVEFKPNCTGKALLNIATVGGYVYCARASPKDPGRLAVGVGDNVIRIWNTNEGAGSYSVSNIWQGLKSKVSSVAWHPDNEGQIAYGTDDGWVGMFVALGKKPPRISETFHQKMVYVVSWGPVVLKKDLTNAVYSVGDGTVLIHTFQPGDKAQDLNKLLEKANGGTLPTRVRSAIVWSADYRILYLGSDDGSVLVLRREDLKCLCTIKVSAKLVNSIRLQPAEAHSFSSLMAIGSNEHQVKIVDTSRINTKPQPLAPEADEDQNIPIIHEPIVILRGHKSRVTDICWSIFEPNKLVSVSYDCKAIVWDVAHGVALSEYKRQHGHILTCQWSLLDPDMIYTGSDDHSLHGWQPSKHLKVTPPARSTAPSVNGNSVETSSSKSTPTNGDLTDEKQLLTNGEISKLIEQKKKELAAAESVHESEDFPSQNGEEVPLPVSVKKQASKLKKKIGKTLFPNMNAKQRRSEEADMEDLEYLQQHISRNIPVSMVKDTEHLGLFSLDNGDDFASFITREKETLFADGNIENGAYVSLWQGNVEEALAKAAAGNALTECLVNSASMLGYKVWTQYCSLYAQQLKNEGLLHKAITYLLYTHEVETALRWLTQNNLYREAICIARSRYPSDDERITQLYESWVRQLAKDANYETAAKCLVALKKPKDALDMLRKRTGTGGLIAAIRFALTSVECNNELMVLCDILARDCIVAGDKTTIRKLCSPHTHLHPFLAWNLVSQSLLPVLESGSSSDFEPLGVVDYIRFLLSSHGVQLKDCKKQCSLAQNFLLVTQMRITICERLLNFAVGAEEGMLPDSVELAELLVMVMMSQPKPLDKSASLLTAQLIHLFTFPGCDVGRRLTECDFKPSHSLTDYALYICYLWSALTVSSHKSAVAGSSDPVSSGVEGSLLSGDSALESGSSFEHSVSFGSKEFSSDIESAPICKSTTHMEAVANAVSIGKSTSQDSEVAARNGSVTNHTSPVSNPLASDCEPSLISTVRSHMYQLTFSLCNGLVLRWIDPQSMCAFRDHLNVLEKELSAAGKEVDELDVMNLVTFVERERATEMSKMTTRGVLAMLLDMLRQLFIYMCLHDDSAHLPNMPPGKQMIREWVNLHTIPCDVLLSEPSDNVPMYKVTTDEVTPQSDGLSQIEPQNVMKESLEAPPIDTE